MKDRHTAYGSRRTGGGETEGGGRLKGGGQGGKMKSNRDSETERGHELGGRKDTDQLLFLCQVLSDLAAFVP
jgi:hypothetical protein